MVGGWSVLTKESFMVGVVTLLVSVIPILILIPCKATWGFRVSRFQAGAGVTNLK